MKRFLTLFLLACGYLGLSQTAYVQLNFSVLDQNSLPAYGAKFYVQDSSGTGSNTNLGTLSVLGDGTITDTIIGNYSSGWIELTYFECNGLNQIIVPYSAANGWNNPVYTTPVTISCYDGCANMFRLVDANRTAYNKVRYNFLDGNNSAWSWSFSDGYIPSGNTFTRVHNTSPTNVSFTLANSTCTYNENVVSSPSAWIRIDSASSGNGILNVVNDTWATAQYGQNHRYYWDFDDGSPMDSVSGAYPTHTYSQPGNYRMSLNYMEYDSNGSIVGRSTMYLNFRIDANGNLYKNGFTVNVIDPASVGIDEESISPITLYPQPADGIVNLQTDAVIDGVEVYNMAGIIVISKTEGDMSLVDLTGQPSGVYMLNIKTEGRTVVEKCIIR